MAPADLADTEVSFKWKALLIIVMIVMIYSMNMLFTRLETVILPFIVAFIIVAIIERPVDILHQMLTGRYDFQGAALHIQAWFSRQRRRISKALDAAGATADAVPGPVSVTTQEENSSEAEDVSQPLNESGLTGVASCWNSLARALSVAIMLVTVLCAMVVFGFQLYQTAVSVKDEIGYYKQGAADWLDTIMNFIGTVFKQLHIDESQVKKLVAQASKSAMRFMEDSVMALVNDIISGVSGFLSFAVISFLYILFWLFEPLPVGWQANRLLRGYIKKKFIVCAGYAICVWLLFRWMGIGLAALFGQASFFLSFIPELGPIISTLLPAPIILLDSRIKHPTLMFVLASLGQLALKFLWGNVIEVNLVQSDDELKIHAVWIVAGLFYFGDLFGPIGMLVAIPLLALMKVTVSNNVPESIARPFVRCVEGHFLRKEEKPLQDV